MVKSAPLARPRAIPRLWSAVILAGLLAVALAMRLVNLESYTGKFDEGIRAEQLFLMSMGFRPVREVFAAQGPLSLDIFFGPYLAFGQTLAAARTAVVIYSLVGIGAVFWVGRMVAGVPAGLIGAAVLTLSPLYLKNSRLALLEVPVMVPATLALGAALCFQASGKRGWLLLSAAMLALALLIKPMAVGVVVPIGLTLLLRSRRRTADFLLFGATVSVVAALVVVLYGPEQVWQQVVTYRVRAAGRWSLGGNWSTMLEELRDEQLPIYVLGLSSACFVAFTHPRWGLPLAAWPFANLALLLVYSPLQFKHVAILLPPLALLVGTAVACFALRGAPLVPLVKEGRLREVAGKAGPGLLALAAGVWYLSSLPAVVRQDWLVMSATTESRVETYADEARLIPLLTGPEEFVLVDEPIVAFNSRRKVPPGLVDPSSFRVRSGALSGAEVIEATDRYDVKLLVLLSDGLRELKKFEEYVDGHYRAVKIYERQNAKDRALYLREDADLLAARAILARDLDRRLQADFGGDLRLLGYTLGRDEPRAGGETTLMLHWEAIRRMATDYHVITHMRGPGGQPDVQSERSLGGGGAGTANWAPGRWVFRSQVLTIPPRTPTGDYQLSVELYDSRSRTSPPLTAGESVGSTELILGRVRVR